MLKIFFLILGVGMSNFSESARATDTGSFSNLKVHVLRLIPGDDPYLKLESFVNEKKLRAVIILTGVGSLTKASIRYANDPKATVLDGPFEIVSLTGTLSAQGGSHIHISISDAKGKTLGGHLLAGSKIFTTLEVALGEVNDVEFSRVLDPVSTYKELKVSPLKK